MDPALSKRTTRRKLRAIIAKERGIREAHADEIVRYKAKIDEQRQTIQILKSVIVELKKGKPTMMKPNKTVCAKCAHARVATIVPMPMHERPWHMWTCAAATPDVHTDYVVGIVRHEFRYCRDINKTGECSMYESGNPMEVR